MSRDKTKLAFSMNEAGISKGYILNLRNSLLSTWKMPMGVMLEFSFSPQDDKLAYVFNGPNQPTNIWMLDLFNMEVERLTNLSSTLGNEEPIMEPAILSYESFDRLRIPVFFYKPNISSKSQPVIIYIHGGPESQFRPTNNPLFHNLLKQGYMIYAPNIRGSTGYGKSYTHLDDGRNRMNAVKDVVSLAELLKREGNRKLAIIGESYGGFVVLAAITHYPTLWSAAIDLFGISSIKTFLNHTSPWRKKLREMEYGTIEKDGTFYDLIDPIHYIDRITSPLMVVHGANDPRVPIKESEQIVTKLRQRNHPVKYILFNDEGHSLNKSKNMLHVFNELTSFLREYLLGK